MTPLAVPSADPRGAVPGRTGSQPTGLPPWGLTVARPGRVWFNRRNWSQRRASTALSDVAKPAVGQHEALNRKRRQGTPPTSIHLSAPGSAEHQKNTLGGHGLIPKVSVLPVTRRQDPDSTHEGHPALRAGWLHLPGVNPWPCEPPLMSAKPLWANHMPFVRSATASAVSGFCPKPPGSQHRFLSRRAQNHPQDGRGHIEKRVTAAAVAATVFALVGTAAGASGAAALAKGAA